MPVYIYTCSCGKELELEHSVKQCDTHEAYCNCGKRMSRKPCSTSIHIKLDGTQSASKALRSINRDVIKRQRATGKGLYGRVGKGSKSIIKP